MRPPWPARGAAAPGSREPSSDAVRSRSAVRGRAIALARCRRAASPTRMRAGRARPGVRRFRKASRNRSPSASARQRPSSFTRARALEDGRRDRGRPAGERKLERAQVVVEALRHPCRELPGALRVDARARALDPRSLHLSIADRAERVLERLHLVLQLDEIGVAEDAERRPEATGGHAHVVHRVRVGLARSAVVTECGLLAAHVREPRADDEGLGDGERGIWRQTWDRRRLRHALSRWRRRRNTASPRAGPRGRTHRRRSAAPSANPPAATYRSHKGWPRCTRRCRTRSTRDGSWSSGSRCSSGSSIARSSRRASRSCRSGRGR